MNDLFDKVSQLSAEGKACMLVTVVDSAGAVPGKVGFKMIVLPDKTTFGTVGGGDLEAAAIDYAAELLASEKSELKHYNLDELGMGCGGSVSLFFEYQPPARTLLIFGGGHCGQALAQMAKLLGFRVKVYDSRANLHGLFPDGEFIHCDLEHLTVDTFPASNAYVAIMTYNHVFDYSVLKQILTCGKSFEYIGLIGSVNKVRATRQRLQSEKIAIPDCLYAPIGLKIGAQTAAEIAVAILGEIIGVYHHTPVDSLRNLV